MYRMFYPVTGYNFTFPKFDIGFGTNPAFSRFCTVMSISDSVFEKRLHILILISLNLTGAHDKMRNRYPCIRLITSLLLIFTALSILFIELPSRSLTPMVKRALNDGHFFLFAAIAYLILRLLNFRTRAISQWRDESYLVALMLCALLSISSEWLQRFFGRDSEIRDMIFNSSGFMTTLGSLFIFKSRFMKRFGKRTRFSLQLLFLIVLTITATGLFFNLGSLIYYHFSYQHRLPLIASFEHDWELITWEKSPATDIEFNLIHASHGSRSLKIDCHSYSYPGIRLEFVPPDWSAYRAFAFDIFNPQATALELKLRIDAKNDTSSISTRRYDSLSIQPGWNHLSLPTSAIKTNREGKSMILKNVLRVIFFMRNPPQTLTFFIDNVRFE
ncbi:VanZ family protein [candidate division KSB1 bacterium]|nr:VanZ family protein [candidate division KSB1 bacterium]